MNYFRHHCSTLINLLLPQRCALCSNTTNTSAAICPTCTSRLPDLPSACCPGCADYSPAGTLCGHCLTSPCAFDGVTAPFLYADPVDHLIQALKYGHQLRLANWLGEHVGESLAATTTQNDRFDALVPLPLHPARMRARGFNQAMEIARPIARRLGLPILGNLAFRIRNTLPQAELARDQRQHNLRNAFECRCAPDDLSGKSLLIIDDVLTTGSSANELARVLKLHGAARVLVAVAARTHHH